MGAPLTVGLIVLAVFLAAFMQTLAGFGFALLVMPLLTLMVGLRNAAPLVALAGLTLYSVNFFRYRQAVAWREVVRLGAGIVWGVPLGVWALSHVAESAVQRLLGVVLVLYAGYALWQPGTLYLRSRGWVYAFGFVAGCLGGAYNTPGPPLVMYGALRRWPKEPFRAVLQSLFILNATLVVALHYFSHHLTASVFQWYFYALPALFSGILLGSRVDRKLSGVHFRVLVTVMILLLGLSLLR